MGVSAGLSGTGAGRSAARRFPSGRPARGGGDGLSRETRAPSTPRVGTASLVFRIVFPFSSRSAAEHLPVPGERRLGRDLAGSLEKGDDGRRPPGGRGHEEAGGEARERDQEGKQLKPIAA